MVICEKQFIKGTFINMPSRPSFVCLQALFLDNLIIMFQVSHVGMSLPTRGSSIVLPYFIFVIIHLLVDLRALYDLISNNQNIILCAYKHATYHLPFNTLEFPLNDEPWYPRLNPFNQLLADKTLSEPRKYWYSFIILCQSQYLSVGHASKLLPTT